MGKLLLLFGLPFIFPLSFLKKVEAMIVMIDIREAIFLDGIKGGEDMIIENSIQN